MQPDDDKAAMTISEHDPSSPKQRPAAGSATHRASIVGAQLFSEKGYAATTTRELSRAIGVTNGTFYHHFETKEDLLVQICEESLGRMREAAEAAIAGADPGAPRAGLEALIKAHLVTMLEDQPLHTTGLIELRSLSPERRSRVEESREAYAAIARRQIEACQQAGALRQDLPSSILTLLLLNTLNWTVFWFDPAGQLTAEELSDAVVTLFLDGAAAAG